MIYLKWHLLEFNLFTYKKIFNGLLKTITRLFRICYMCIEVKKNGNHLNVWMLMTFELRKNELKHFFNKFYSF